MPRVAWFTPLPPVRSGIAAYSAEVLPLLVTRYEIDAFIDPAAPVPASDPGVAVYPSHEFIWRHHHASPYDLAIYQLGNATCHDYMWPYLIRYPGLVVLHDAQLHHSRSRALFAAGRHDDYRREFAFCHGESNQGVADVIIGGHGGSLYYLWPLTGVPIACSRLVAVHNPWLARHLDEQHPEQEFAVIRMGVAGGPGRAGEERKVRDSVFSRHRIPDDRVVFAAYGMLTPEKRLSDIIRALSAVSPYAPNVHLMLVGQPVDWYDAKADARAAGVEDRVTVTGYVPAEELQSYVTAADVCLCLRWPTSRETSASWLRCLAAGKPTIITELAQTCSVPALDPRSWTVLDGSDGNAGSPVFGLPTADRSPVCVAVDIVDEQHSLALAMRRLARDEAMRQTLGESAREYWARHHTLQHMAEDYEHAIGRALRRPGSDPSRLPVHLLPDGTGLTAGIIGQFGLPLARLDWGAGQRVVDSSQ